MAFRPSGEMVTQQGDFPLHHINLASIIPQFACNINEKREISALNCVFRRIVDRSDKGGVIVVSFVACGSRLTGNEIVQVR